MDYLDRLARDLENDPALRAALIYRPNTSLYRAAGRVRYAEGRLDAGARGEARAYHLVAVRADLFLDAALAAAAGGATLAALAAAVAAADPEDEIELAEAEAFVHELIDTQVLVSDLGPRITGELPIHGLIARLASIPGQEAAAARLAEARDALAALDAAPLGSSPSATAGIGRRLAALGTRVDLPRLFQVDMTKEAVAVTLGSAHGRGARTGDRLPPPAGAPAFAHDPFASFREAFLRRYEPGRLVPLCELLDEEAGIGFQRSAAVGSDNSPLLAGIHFPARAADVAVPWSRAQDLLMRKTFDAAQRGDAEVVFTDADLAALDGPAGAAGHARRPPSTPPSRRSSRWPRPRPKRSDRGEFRLLFRGASGASGGTLLGRFCHADPELERRLAEHLRHEESHQPDAVFAEIVHLPEGRIGNILLRPLLRAYEIPYLGQGGADPERQLPLGDLCATVLGDHVVLWSQRLGKRVIPRLSSAHNYSLRGLGVYKFLSALQHQGTCGGLSWQWGALDQLPFLPRVSYGRTILAAARWRVDKAETASWLGPDGNALPEALARWREERRIPRRVLLGDADNELFVDFASPLVLEAFVAIVRNRPFYWLIENLQEAEGLVAPGPEGRFTHEIVLPFVRRPAPAAAAGAFSGAFALRRQPLANHPPGSRWVYAKLYTGTATADGVLAEVAGPLVRRFAKEIGSFFFLRYSDPDFHLRLRFELPEEGARQELIRRLSALAAELLREGRIWDLRFETYRPEVERYGGPEALRQCERIFQADSEAALALLPHFQGDEGAGQRWLAALASVDGLTAACCGEDSAARIACLEGLARSFAAEFRFDKISRQTLADRLRAEKSRLDAVLERRAEPGSPLAAAFAAFEIRRRALQDPLARLRRLETEGKLASSLPALASSFAHMSLNRLMPAEARAHEAVIYEILHRHLLSRQARQAAAPVAGNAPAAEMAEALIAGALR